MIIIINNISSEQNSKETEQIIRVFSKICIKFCDQLEIMFINLNHYIYHNHTYKVVKARF